MSNGSEQQPGKGFNKGHDLIDWSRRKALCGSCLKPADKCGCVPTEDGPGQAEADEGDEK